MILYQIRLFPSGGKGESRSIGFKGRLLKLHRAARVLRFLKARGREGYLARLNVDPGSAKGYFNWKSSRGIGGSI